MILQITGARQLVWGFALLLAIIPVLVVAILLVEQTVSLVVTPLVYILAVHLVQQVV